MDILLLTEAGKNIGFGHLTRCLALCEAFQERGMDAEIVLNSDNSVLSFLNGRNYQIFDWIKQKNKMLNIIRGKKVIIIDSYLANRYLYDQIYGIAEGILVVIDDFNRIGYPHCILVNPSIYGDKIEYMYSNDIIYLLGKKYIILRKEFWKIPEKNINKKIKDVLISFGGLGYFEVGEKIGKFLKKEFGYNSHLVNIYKHGYSAGEMIDLMLTADICISGGGQTTYELARIGVPTIGLSLAENQLLNLEYWERTGFLKNAGWIDDKGLLERLKKIIEGLDYVFRLRSCRVGRKHVDGQGARNIVKKVLKII
jgi:UDP-2,4-diacetamido-2,4,6-trideoxy-beta-L-altropyranose hydrolase